jgi:hypothetical protein
MQFSIETSGAIGYGFHLYFDRDSKLIAFGHDDDLREKNSSYKTRKYQFSCDDKDKCKRYKKKATGFIEWEECDKSEVESKWGYKLW